LNKQESGELPIEERRELKDMQKKSKKYILEFAKELARSKAGEKQASDLSMHRIISRYQDRITAQYGA
jgi:hypothetical protein